MSRSTLIRRCAAIALAFAMGNAVASEILGEDAPKLQAGEVTVVDHVKRQTAREIARMLGDARFAGVLQQKLDEQQGKVKVNALVDAYQKQDIPMSLRHRSSELKQLDTAVRRFKGTEALTNGLMEVRLFQPQGFAAQVDVKDMLVAFEPAGDDKRWTTVEAYDRNGNIHKLDAHHRPDVPVLIADVDGREDLRAGIAYVNTALTKAGLQQAHNPMARAGKPLDTARLDKIRLKNDEEPWISGAAEVYALVSGIQPDQAKAQINLVDMPYLDYSGQDYYPNQVLIVWNDYRYQAANVLLYEHDDNTNYKDLVVAIISGVEKILGAFKPEFAVIATVAGAIVQAMPSHWFSNDDDYVDSFYTLEKGKTYTDYPGAGANAVITLTPLQIKPN
ncbi:DUF3103 family protein [Parachitinimonas caeni]|uniref:DUF3103 family protein n=1 Tax=Parachitinimonas caeni TaxID=3031301 RepID=A0ABT7DWE6_9NEIS|nr:DUF3103 family protein [Parachitinimonas caeni]MDK2124385.1 DUF3103 family protein [Parachitinimonas caeni]